jgi:glycosyltransferase involved in cell wall biosynthesis
MLGGARADVDVVTRSHVFLLEALERWLRCRPEIAERVELVLAGKTTQHDRAVVEDSGVARLVRLPGYVSHAESVDLIRDAELLFLPMHDVGPRERSRIVPGKTYEYMASGRPILAAVPNGDARDFLAECGTALLCRPDDVEAMVGILGSTFDRWEAGHPIARRDAAFLARFERGSLGHAFAETLRNVVGAEHRRPRSDGGKPRSEALAGTGADAAQGLG